MATKTPSSKPKTSPINKAKNGTQLGQNLNGPSDLECSFADRDIAKGLNEKDVEIEHLKTTVIALDEKVKVTLSTFTYPR